MTYICPKCLQPGEKQPKRRSCTACHILEASYRTQQHTLRLKQQRAEGKTHADVVAMQGFNPVSQQYLSIKL